MGSFRRRLAFLEVVSLGAGFDVKILSPLPALPSLYFLFALLTSCLQTEDVHSQLLLPAAMFPCLDGRSSLWNCKTNKLFLL